MRPETYDYKFTLSKIDRDWIFKLLIKTNSLDVVSSFIKDIDVLVKVDVESFSVRISDKQQNETLAKFLKKTNELLELLREIRFDDLSEIAIKNLQTVILIQDSLSTTRVEKASDADAKDTAHIFPFNYPTELTDTLYEFRDAIEHAANGVKQKVGNSRNRDPENIRKRVMAMLFVQCYTDRFGKLPPITETSAANKVLNKLFMAAGLQRDAERHSLRLAVENKKGIPQTKRKKRLSKNKKNPA